MKIRLTILLLLLFYTIWISIKLDKSWKANDALKAEYQAKIDLINNQKNEEVKKSQAIYQKVQQENFHLIQQMAEDCK